MVENKQQKILGSPSALGNLWYRQISVESWYGYLDHNEAKVGGEKMHLGQTRDRSKPSAAKTWRRRRPFFPEVFFRPELYFRLHRTNVFGSRDEFNRRPLWRRRRRRRCRRQRRCGRQLWHKKPLKLKQQHLVLANVKLHPTPCFVFNVTDRWALGCVHTFSTLQRKRARTGFLKTSFNQIGPKGEAELSFFSSDCCSAHSYLRFSFSLLIVLSLSLSLFLSPF